MPGSCSVPSLWRETPKSRGRICPDCREELSVTSLTRLQSVNVPESLPLPNPGDSDTNGGMIEIAVARAGSFALRILAVTGLLVFLWLGSLAIEAICDGQYTNAALYLFFAVAYASWAWSQYRDGGITSTISGKNKTSKREDETP